MRVDATIENYPTINNYMNCGSLWKTDVKAEVMITTFTIQNDRDQAE